MKKKALALINNDLLTQNNDLSEKYQQINQQTTSLKNEIDILNIQQKTQRNTKIKIIRRIQ